MNIYQQKGYKSRDHYLRSFAREMGVSYTAIKILSDILGPNEDFDGLVTEAEDFADCMED